MDSLQSEKDDLNNKLKKANDGKSISHWNRSRHLFRRWLVYWNTKKQVTKVVCLVKIAENVPSISSPLKIAAYLDIEKMKSWQIYGRKWSLGHIYGRKWSHGNIHGRKWSWGYTYGRFFAFVFWNSILFTIGLDKRGIWIIIFHKKTYIVRQGTSKQVFQRKEKKT